MSQPIAKLQDRMERTFSKKGVKVLAVVGLLWLLGKGFKKVYDLVDLTWVLTPKKIKNLPQRYGAGSYVIIAGATNRIGVQYAEAFAMRGFNLVLIDADAQKLDTLKASIESKGWKSTIKTIVADFKTATGPEFYEDIHKQTTGLDVSILVNNVHLWQYGPFEKRGTTHLLEHVAANLIPTVLMTREYINELQVRKPHSAVINVTLAFGDFPLPNFVMQSASTSFVNYFTECLAKEYRGLGVDVLLFKASLDLFDELRAAGKIATTTQAQKSIEGSLTWLGRGRVDTFGTKTDDLLGFLFSNSPRFKKRMMSFVSGSNLAEGLQTQKALAGGDGEEEKRVEEDFEMPVQEEEIQFGGNPTDDNAQGPAKKNQRNVRQGAPEEGDDQQVVEEEEEFKPTQQATQGKRARQERAVRAGRPEEDDFDAHETIVQLAQERDTLLAERDGLIADKARLEKESGLLKMENDKLKSEVASLTQEKSSGSQSHDQERKKLQDEKNKLQTELDQVKAEKEQLKGERDILLRDKADLQRDINDIKGSLQGESSLLNEEKERIRAEKNKLELENQQLKTERDELKAQSDKLKEERDRLQGEKEQVVQEIAKCKEGCGKKDEVINTLNGEKDQLTTERDQLKGENGQLKEERDRLQGEKDQVVQEIAKCKEGCGKKDEVINSLKGEKEQLEKERDALKAENDGAKAEIENLKKERDQLQENTNGANDENAKIKAERDQLKTENETIKSETETLKTENKNLKDEIESLKNKAPTETTETTKTEKSDKSDSSSSESEGEEETKEGGKPSAKDKLAKAAGLDRKKLQEIGKKRSSKFSIKDVVRMASSLDDQRKIIANDVKAVSEDLRKKGVRQCNLSIGIDCTASNEFSGKVFFDGKSLHAISDKEMNPYEEVMQILGSIVMHFDNDSKIPVFLFGDAKTRAKSVRPLYSEGGEEACKGLDHLLSVYRDTIPKVELAGPTTFKPLIEKVVGIAKKTRQFQCLVIVGDGAVTNMKENIDAITKASEFPVAIVMVGVGDGDSNTKSSDPWAGMRELDSGVKGRKFDNFNFVLYQKGMSPSEFARLALSELPEQFAYCVEQGWIDE